MYFGRLVLVAMCVFAANPSYGWSVLGCEFGINISGFIQCVNNSSANAVTIAVTQAREAHDTAMEELENSPYLAMLPGEQQALLALRNLKIEEFVACLSGVGISFGNVASNIANNPAGFTETIMVDLYTKAANLSGPLLDASLSVLTGTPPTEVTPQQISALIDRADEAMSLLARQDPVANCALPLLATHRSALKQAAASTYNAMQTSISQIISQTVQPMVNQAMIDMLNPMIAEMKGSTFSPPPGIKTNLQKGVPLQRAFSVGRGEQRVVRANKRTTSSASVRKAPRTRSADTFLPQVNVQQAMEWAVDSVMPDDVKSIALAEFTKRMLHPTALERLTAETNALSSALANGTAASFDLSRFNQYSDSLSYQSAAIATAIGLETTRFYGHWLIDESGSKILDLGLGSVNAVDAIVKEAGGAICSLADIFGGAACGIVKGIVSFLYQQVAVPTIKWSMLKRIHIDYDLVLNCAAQAIQAGQNPSLQPGMNCGVFGPLLNGFPTGEQLAAFALPALQETQTALFAYQRSVANLAQVARNTAPR